MIEKKVLSPTLDQFAKAIVLPFFKKGSPQIDDFFLEHSAFGF